MCMNVHDECAWVCMKTVCMNTVYVNMHGCGDLCMYMKVHGSAWMLMKVRAWMLMNAFGTEWGSAPSSCWCVELYIYPHHIDEYMYVGGRGLIIWVSRHADLSLFLLSNWYPRSCLLAPNVTKDGPTFTKDYSDVFALPFDTIGRAKYAIFLQRHHILQAGHGYTSPTVRFFPLLLTFFFCHLLRAQCCVEKYRHYGTTTDRAIFNRRSIHLPIATLPFSFLSTRTVQYCCCQ